MNPFHRTYARFHKKLLTKTMAIGVILALMGKACLIQLANIQLINGKTMAQAAAQSRTITVTLKARRGKIMDTNGSILAQSVERYTIIGNPEEAQAFTPTTCTKQTGDNCHQIDGKPVGATGAAAVARLLAPVLDMDATELGADDFCDVGVARCDLVTCGVAEGSLVAYDAVARGCSVTEVVFDCGA